MAPNSSGVNVSDSSDTNTSATSNATGNAAVVSDVAHCRSPDQRVIPLPETGSTGSDGPGVLGALLLLVIGAAILIPIVLAFLGILAVCAVLALIIVGVAYYLIEYDGDSEAG